MSAAHTTPTTDTATTRRRLPTAVVVTVQTVLVVGLVLGAGAVAGVVWQHLWTPPVGTVQSGRWFTGETGLRAQFSATGLYVAVALAAGLLCGVVSGLLLARWELLTLVVLLAGAIGAGLLMRHVGLAQGPPDPDLLARSAADGTRLPGDLTLRGGPPLVALPLGAVVGYAALLIGVGKRGAGRPDDHLDEEPDQSVTRPEFSPPPPG